MPILEPNPIIPNIDYYHETDAREVRALQELSIADNEEYFMTSLFKVPTILICTDFDYGRLNEAEMKNYGVVVSRSVGGNHALWMGTNVISARFYLNNGTAKMMHDLVYDALNTLGVGCTIEDKPVKEKAIGGKEIFLNGKIVGGFTGEEQYGTNVFIGNIISIIVDYSEAEKCCSNWNYDIRRTAGINQLGYALTAQEIIDELKNKVPKHFKRTLRNKVKDTQRIAEIRDLKVDRKEWINYGREYEPNNYTGRESDL